MFKPISLGGCDQCANLRESASISPCSIMVWPATTRDVATRAPISTTPPFEAKLSGRGITSSVTNMDRLRKVQKIDPRVANAATQLSKLASLLALGNWDAPYCTAAISTVQPRSLNALSISAGSDSTSLLNGSLACRDSFPGSGMPQLIMRFSAVSQPQIICPNCIRPFERMCHLRPARRRARSPSSWHAAKPRGAARSSRSPGPCASTRGRG